MQAPFPYFGGKSAVADVVWRALGDVQNYVEPFAGSAAILLARPDAHRWWERTETINDADGLVANFWRATRAAPEEVARHADWPVNECDLHARHAWLVGQKASLQTRLEGAPEWFDAKVAGWWVWGICAWIGGGWCSGKGPWHVAEGELLRTASTADEDGIMRRRAHLGDGRGINRKLVHLGGGRGINRKLVHLGSDGRGQCDAWSEHLRDTMQRLADRLRRVRVCCGDWARVCGLSPTVHLGMTGVLIDPPYSRSERDSAIYAVEMETTAAVRTWAVERGDDPALRIALCGYEGEHDMPADWTSWRWTTHGGYAKLGAGRGRDNATRETVWFSPHCLRLDRARQASLPLE